MDPRLLDALVPVVEAFEEMGIDYQLGGSLASSVHGIPRSSLDVDLLSSLELDQVAELVTKLGDAYYVSKTRALDGVQRGSSFNVIHLGTMFKVDIFVARSDNFRRTSLGRRKLEALAETRSLFVTSAEDIVLHKLQWYRNGGEVSNQQWQDIVGVLTVQSGRLDMDYLEQWAAELNVGDLLKRGIAEAASHGSD